MLLYYVILLFIYQSCFLVKESVNICLKTVRYPHQ
nr:MAG TPA: hypothetical protein [Inoviridae sp.]